MTFFDRWRKRKEDDLLYEKKSNIERDEPPQFAALPHYTWKDIERLEEERVPWMGRKRRRQP